MKNSNIGDMPAQPISEEMTDRIDEGVKIYSGLTIKQELAARAMQAMLSSKYVADFASEGRDKLNKDYFVSQKDAIACCANEYADALIESWEKDNA